MGFPVYHTLAGMDAHACAHSPPLTNIIRLRAVQPCSQQAIIYQRLIRMPLQEQPLNTQVHPINVSSHPTSDLPLVAGHNGAGKTTAISVLTGMIPASGGSAYVGSHNIASEMAQIRKSLGVCPQFDILWPSITVREHLEIFAAIKGFAASERSPLAEAAAADVGAGPSTARVILSCRLPEAY